MAEEKEKKKKKKDKKDSQLLLRINRETRDAFSLACEENNTTAAKEIRAFIENYLAEHQQPNS